MCSCSHDYENNSCVNKIKRKAEADRLFIIRWQGSVKRCRVSLDLQGGSRATTRTRYQWLPDSYTHVPGFGGRFRATRFCSRFCPGIIQVVSRFCIS